ncbi:hypothetical protein [Paenibacillus sp. IHB B 3415]|uniref:hypothetical protein n=1 Tax=Paenibacillus sp. IHB B 3415 TaxID=867080 RepID=UPI00069AABF5|nr:hypothetical protein [Paenibacillus sp. IHB B 3415]
MLDDTARKLLRIMFQFNGHVHRMPSLDELKRLSGRRPKAIKAGLRQLVEQYHIQWDDRKPVETAVVIEAWERDVPFKDHAAAGPHKSQQTPLTGNIDYWTDY